MQLKSSLSKWGRALTGKRQPHEKDTSPTACLNFGVISHGRVESRVHKYFSNYSDYSTNNILYRNLYICTNTYFPYIHTEPRCLIKHSRSALQVSHTSGVDRPGDTR